jgi:selenocysteine lyase/cysteine desulfurase
MLAAMPDRSPLSRRDLLVRAGVVAGAAALPAGATESIDEAAAAFDPRSWDSVRKQFPLDRRLAHFAAFVLAAHPAPVRAALERHRRRLDANPWEYVHTRDPALRQSVRDEAARHMGGAADEIALTDSTTMGLGLLYGGLRLSAGDEILTTQHDFYATHEALRLTAERTGAAVRKIRLYRQLATVSEDEIVSAVAAALSPRTRVVALTWVHSSTGLKLPLRAIAEAVGGRALVCVDAVHALGVENIDLRSLGCDFFVAGCHKWLAGPRGTGIVWGKRKRWRETLPTIPSFEDGESYVAWANDRAPTGPSTAIGMTPGGYHSFEHRWALADAFRFHRSIGEARVAARVHALAARLKDRLAAVRGVNVITPRRTALSAGIVCVDVPGQRPEAVVDRLRNEHRVVATVTPYATSYVRLGPGLYTSVADVDRAAKALAAIA